MLLQTDYSSDIPSSILNRRGCEVLQSRHEEADSLKKYPDLIVTSANEYKESNGRKINKQLDF